MNFDQENVKSFLQRIAPFIDSGFGSNEINRVVELIDGLDHDEEKGLEFSIVFKAQPSPFLVRAFMDDIQAPDLSFFGPPELAERITFEMRAFCEELGI